MNNLPSSTPGMGFIKAEWWPMYESRENADAPVELSPWVKKFVRKYVIRYPGENKIFHYTTVEAFFRIIKTNDIYVSHVRYLNDVSEVTHGQELAIDALRKLATKPRFGAFSQILKNAAETISANGVKDYFVASFSRSGDDLTQWRSYGKSAGICIEFDLARPQSFVHFWSPRLARAVYKTDDKLRLIFFWIQKYLTEFRAELCRWESMPDWAPNAYAESLAKKLEQEFSRFKHNCFSSEQEIRLIISGDDRICLPRRYRTSGNFIVPYYHASDTSRRSDGSICLDGTVIESPKLPLASVMIGPMQNQRLCAQGVREFIAAHGYDPNIVQVSNLPYHMY